jgi:hypothetical protein
MGSTTISISTINEIAINGSEEDFINLLKSTSGYVITEGDRVGDSGLRVGDSALDYIFYAAAKDSDADRKARKISLAAAFQAKEGIFRDKECISAEEIAKASSEEGFVNLLKSHGNKHLDDIVGGAAKDEDDARKSMKMTLVAAYKAREGIFIKADKQLLTTLAFNGPSDKLVNLLKAFGNDQEAVQAIIAGAQMDQKRRFRRATKEDKSRRSDKKDIIAEFHTKSGRFTPVEEAAPDAPAAQARIAELENRAAEMETVAAKQQPAGPTRLRLQQP